MNNNVDLFYENLQDYLHDQGIGIRSVDLFYGGLTGDPDNQIAILKTGGVEPDKDLPIAKPTAQIMVRNTDYNTGEAKIQAIFNLLHQRYDNFTLVSGGVDVMKSDALQEPTHLGKDSEERHLFTCNFVFWIRR